MRSIYSLVTLLKDHYDFYIITTNYDLGSNIPYKDIKPDVLFEKEGISYFYFSKENLNPENIIRQINSIKPHLVYVNSFWSYHFSIAVIKAKKQKQLSCPVLLAPRGMLSSGALGLKSIKKRIFLFLGKIFSLYNDITFHATNEIEKSDIKRQFRNARIFVAANVNSGRAYPLEKPKQERHIKLFYLSRIAKVKNLHFALNILSDVPAEINVEYDIYGNIEDKEYWTECLEIISKLPINIKVTYRHELQFNEVQPIIVSYHALFLPTLNENFGHSIVESLLCGCPVIISDQTPWSDVEQNNAGYALGLSDKQGFVNSIVKLARLNKNDYSLTSAGAINYISKRLNIEQSIEQYKKLFDESANK